MARLSSILCRHVLTDNTVPKDAFKGAKGVVFLQAAAAAVGLTAFRGQGFIVAKVDGAWSAPAFIRLSTMGMGFSLGGACQHFSSNCQETDIHLLSPPPHSECFIWQRGRCVVHACLDTYAHNGAYTPAAHYFPLFGSIS